MADGKKLVVSAVLKGPGHCINQKKLRQKHSKLFKLMQVQKVCRTPGPTDNLKMFYKMEK